MTSYTAWDQYVAEIWAAFFSKYRFPLDGAIVDVAPGASSKIALALKKINFRGDIYIIEPYQQALELVSYKYRELLPEATIHPLDCLLIDSFKLMPTPIDCVISHHALDDMIMAMDGSPTIFEQLFSWVTQDKLEIHPDFESHWQALSAHPQKHGRIETKVINQWLSLITEIKPSWLMMSQYPSLVLETATMKSLNHCAQHLLQKIKCQIQSQSISDLEIQRVLNHNPNYNFDLIGNEVLHAKNWLIYSGL